MLELAQSASGKGQLFLPVGGHWLSSCSIRGMNPRSSMPHPDVSRNWNFDEDASGLNAEDRDEQRNASDTP